MEKELTDKELVKKILAGDALIFRTIISNTQGLVIQIIYKMVDNPEDRKDLAQEVYLKVYKKLGSFQFQSKLSTWIARITYNTCINFLKKKKIPLLDEIGLEGNDTSAAIDRYTKDNRNNQIESYIYKKERSQIIALEIEKLKPLYRTIITLYHKEGLSYKEIGKITNLPEGTLKNYLYRARKELRDKLLLNYKKEDL